ncbi:MAG: twin-arginine translocation signal domain-containing protein [Bradyrhizobium guangdongense]|jgi:hypothetical protein
MERRDFLKFALGAAAASAALAASAQAAPLTPQPIEGPGVAPRANPDVQPAVTSSEEAAELKPEQVHWRGRGHHWGWHRRRHWGWRRRHWRRHWRRRYWY